MGRTFYRRHLRKALKIRERMSSPSSLFDHNDQSNGTQTKRSKLKQEIDRYLALEDLERAEKKLKKMLRFNFHDSFALSKLISLYTKQERFEDGEKLYKNAEEKEVDAPVVYTSGITLYHESGKPEEAKRVFELAVDRGFVDEATYSAMLNINIDTGNTEGVERIVRLACADNTATISVYGDAFNFYFKNEKFGKALSMIEEAPPIIRERPRMRIAEMEIYRRMKKYGMAIELADDFLKEYSEDRFDEDYYIHARTIRAFCLLHSGKELKALGEFALLRNRVENSSVHYPRILCGFIFSKPVLTDREREHLLADLDFFGLATGESMQDKIENAVKIIEKENREQSKI